MIKGKMVVVGTMVVDGEEMTGCFIECTVDEMRNNRADIYCDVEVRAEERKLPHDNQRNNFSIS